MSSVKRILINLLVLFFLFLLCFLASYCSAQEIEYKVEYLFNFRLDDDVYLSHDRPTPVMAVNNRNEIAFPIRKYVIGIFNLEGQYVDSIVDSLNCYPQDMLYNSHNSLQVLGYDKINVIQYRDGKRTEYPLRKLTDWYTELDTNIIKYLDSDQLDNPKNGPPIWKFQNIHRIYDLYQYRNIVYYQKDYLIIYDSDTKSEIKTNKFFGDIFGIVNDSIIVSKLANGCGHFINILRDKRELITYNDSIISDKMSYTYDFNIEKYKFRSYNDCYKPLNSSNTLFMITCGPPGYNVFKITYSIKSGAK